MAPGLISQLAVDLQGAVYVFQRSDPPVLAFEPSGAFRGGLFAGRIADAHGIAITGDDRLLLVDRDAHQLLIATTAGQV